jgi:hypothetical protein
MSFERFGAGSCSWCEAPATEVSCASRPPDAAVSHLPGLRARRDILAEEMPCAAEPASAQPIDPQQVIAQMVAAGVPDEIVEQVRETIALTSMPVDERRAVLAKRRAERGLRERLRARSATRRASAWRS